MFMKKIFIITLTLTFSFLAFGNKNNGESTVCKLTSKDIKVVGEAAVPTWNPKAKKTMLMQIPYHQFTSPFPDFVEFHISTSVCEDMKITSVEIFRQLGPQDWVNKKKKSASEDDHASHKKPNDILKWETNSFKKFSPEISKKDKLILVKHIPVEEPLEDHKDKEHVWALKFKINFDSNSKKETHELVLEAPLIH